MDQMEISLRKILFKKSFYEFLKYFWNEVEPAPFVDGPLIQFYCETFQYMCRPWIGYEEIDIQLPEITDDINIICYFRKLNINFFITNPWSTHILKSFTIKLNKWAIHKRGWLHFIPEIF